jgi:hypothetical protein
MQSQAHRLASGSVYRHLEQEWVEDFFRTGSLRLTTLAQCREHEISNRADPRDGRIDFSIRDDSQMMAGVNKAGLRSYMLCASRSCAEPIQRRFNTDSWIEILDVAGFSNAVAKAINCAGEPLFGCCRYVDRKEVNEKAESPISNCFASFHEAAHNPTADISDISSEFAKANDQMAQLAEGPLGDKVYFMKDRPYEVEEEFRFVWPVDHAVDDPKVFSCPGALQFCKAGP